MAEASVLHSVREFSTEQQLRIWERSRQMQANPAEYTEQLAGKIVALVFTEQHTHTSLVFQAATIRLGGSPILSPEMSLKKGESLRDTIRVIGSLAELVVLRANPQEMLAIVDATSVPVIDASDGSTVISGAETMPGRDNSSNLGVTTPDMWVAMALMDEVMHQHLKLPV